MRVTGNDPVRQGHHRAHGSLIIGGKQDIALGDQPDHFRRATGLAPAGLVITLGDN